MSTKEALDGKIRFDSLRLDQAVFEVRCYNRQVLLANLPEFWESVEERLKTPIRYDSQDGISVCRVSKSRQVSITQDRFTVGEIYPQKKLTDFIKLSDEYYRTVVEVLRTERLTRIGFRLIYSMDFNDPTEVAEAFLQLPFIVVPEGLSLAEKGKPLIPTYYLGWNDGEKIIVYRLKGNASKLSVDLPPQLSLLEEYPEKIEKTYNQFIFDVDVYTTIEVSPDELLPSEWLLQAYDVVRADGKQFFGK